MANTKKMTKKDYFNILKSSYPTSASNYDEVIAFLDHEIELLARKNSADKKPTAQQMANATVADAILDRMGSEPNRLFTVTEIQKEVQACAELTNQRVSAILRGMIAEGKVDRIEDKRKAYFRVIQ